MIYECVKICGPDNLLNQTRLSLYWTAPPVRTNWTVMFDQINRLDRLIKFQASGVHMSFTYQNRSNETTQLRRKSKFNFALHKGTY